MLSPLCRTLFFGGARQGAVVVFSGERQNSVLMVLIRAPRPEGSEVAGRPCTPGLNPIPEADTAAGAGKAAETEANPVPMPYGLKCLGCPRKATVRCGSCGIMACPNHVARDMHPWGGAGSRSCSEGKSDRSEMGVSPGVSRSPPSAAPTGKDRGSASRRPSVPVAGCCPQFPECRCPKARWPQGCYQCGGAIRPGTCISAAAGGRGHWCHAACPERTHAAATPYVPGLEGPGSTPLTEAAYVVLSDAYAPTGVYHTTAGLRKAINQDVEFPPARKDRMSAFPVITVNQAVVAYLGHRPEAGWVRVFR